MKIVRVRDVMHHHRQHDPTQEDITDGKVADHHVRAGPRLLPPQDDDDGEEVSDDRRDHQDAHHAHSKHHRARQLSHGRRVGAV